MLNLFQIKKIKKLQQKLEDLNKSKLEDEVM